MNPGVPAPAVVAMAHTLADAYASHRLPCPWCAQPVQGRNFESHARKVHGSPRVAASDHDPVRLRAIDRSALVAAVVLACAATALVPLLTWAVPLADPLDRVWLVLPLCGWSLVLAAVFDRFHGELTLTGTDVRFRRALGRGTRRLTAPLRVDFGALTRFVSTTPAYEDEGPTHQEERRAGFYLRLQDAHRSLTVGCAHATGFRKHWQSTSGGPSRRRRSVDVWLDRGAFVALQYALARAGALRLVGE